MPRKLALGVIAAVVVINVVIAVFAFAATRNRDLSIPDTAIEFQEAVFGGNYERMWELSAPERRNGITLDEFIAAARDSAPDPDRLLDWTVLNETSGSIARAYTRIQLDRGGIQAHRIMLRQIGGTWLVAEYSAYDGSWPPDEPALGG